MAESPTLRLTAAVALGVLPAAIVLAWLGAEGAVSMVWVAAVVGAGAFGAGLCIYVLMRSWSARAERLVALAHALKEHRPWSHLWQESRDPMGRAERSLIDAADAIVEENDALAEQRDEFEAILRGMTEGVVVTRAGGEVVLLNGAARTLFALDPENDYSGSDFIELCRDPNLENFLSRAMGSEERRMIRDELRIQNPVLRHLDTSAAPVEAPNRAAGGWVFVFRDITRLRSFETARSEFISNLTHELRTPLSALRGYAETLSRGVDDEATRKRFLEIIERQSRRLSRLIEDLVSLSDLERGLTPLKFEELNPRRVLDEAVELMSEEARNRGVQIEVTSSAQIANVPADRDRMHEVMINLIDNALKYTPRGGRVSVSAVADQTDADGRSGVTFVVADTGEGIPQKDIPRLTERFYRVDRARSRELGGTGLGLAIVKHIVQLHRGRLRIESRLREGTTVTVWLPLES